MEERVSDLERKLKEARQENSELKDEVTICSPHLRVASGSFQREQCCCRSKTNKRPNPDPATVNILPSTGDAADESAANGGEAGGAPNARARGQGEDAAYHR